jgi:hypothetical protein
MTYRDSGTRVSCDLQVDLVEHFVEFVHCTSVAPFCELLKIATVTVGLCTAALHSHQADGSDLANPLSRGLAAENNDFLQHTVRQRLIEGIEKFPLRISNLGSFQYCQTI